MDCIQQGKLSEEIRHSNNIIVMSEARKLSYLIPSHTGSLSSLSIQLPSVAHVRLGLP